MKPVGYAQDIQRLLLAMRSVTKATQTIAAIDDVLQATPPDHVTISAQAQAIMATPQPETLEKIALDGGATANEQADINYIRSKKP